MKPSTTSKHSTESDTNTKTADSKTRWLRLPRNPELKNDLMRAYWGRSEPRITGLTLKIMGVNMGALIMLLFGIVYLGEYQNRLIEAKLETFSAEVQLISAALTEGATIENRQPAWALQDQENAQATTLSQTKSKEMARRLSLISGRHILVFTPNGQQIADSQKISGPNGTIELAPLDPPDKSLQSLQTLKKMAGFVLKLLPDRQKLNPYPAAGHPDVKNALNNQISFSAWQGEDKTIKLAAAAPIMHNQDMIGAVLLTRTGKDIEREIGEVWLNVIRIFLVTLILTIILSIYLSGVIARPLRRLAKAAEAVRTGQSRTSSIPDLSNRNDEIGELSLALRDMTEALHQRMDTIEKFSADVSHELKNPLTSLRSAIETLGIIKKPADKQKLMDIITHDLERLDRLISDISKASRLDSELSREKLEHLSLKALIANLLDVYRDPLERQKDQTSLINVKINDTTIQTFDQTKGATTILGIENRLMQVFENLIANALSFSSKEGTITLTLKEGTHTVIIHVTDEGPGIPQGNLETIFERFYSQRPEHEAYGRHSGLGLSICKQIIANHNGEITAANITNKKGAITGARFTIILPKA